VDPSTLLKQPQRMNWNKYWSNCWSGTCSKMLNPSSIRCKTYTHVDLGIQA
jgi:hypothetical protein